MRTLLLRHGISTSNKIKVEEFCIKPKNSLFLLGTLGDNPGLELAPRPITDDEHNTLTAGDALWFNPVRVVLESSVLSFAIGGEQSSGGFQANRQAGRSSSRDQKLSPDPGPAPVEDMTTSAEESPRFRTPGRKRSISNPAAWAAATEITSGTAAVNTRDSSTGNSSDPTEGFDPHPPVVLMKVKNNSTFLISWRGQRAIARSLGWKCALMIWGGPALALLCLYGLLTLTH